MIPAQLAMFDFDDIVRAEVQLDFRTGALWVRREYGEDADRTQLREALGAALGDRRRSSAFTNRVAEAQNDAAREVLTDLRRHVDPTAPLARAYGA